MSSTIHRPHHLAGRYLRRGMRGPPRRWATLVGALLLAALGLAAPAQGAWVTTPPIDTDAGAIGVGGVALASDGGGALVELKQDAAGAHVALATLVNGVWQPLQRVDSGQDGSSSQPVVAVRSNGGVVVAWTNQGAIYAATRNSAAAPLGPPTLVYRYPSAGGVALNPSLSLSVNGAAYLAFTTTPVKPATPGGPGPSGPFGGLLGPAPPGPGPSPAAIGTGTIRLARFDRIAWSVLPAPLNVDSSRDAGKGANRPVVVAAADGTALVAWGEAVGGSPQVFVRRVDRDTPSAFPQQASVAALAGHAGGTADSPSMGFQFDSSFGWIVLRQEFDDGGPRARAIARRIIGDGLGPPVAVDGLAFGTGESATGPAIALDGRGRGFAVAGTQSSHAVVGAHLNDLSAFGPGVRVDTTANSIAPAPAVAEGQFDTQLIGWENNAGAGASVHARVASRGVLGPERVVSTAALDPTGGLGAGMDKFGDGVLGFVQGAGAARQVMGALYAAPPSAPRLLRHGVVASRNGRPTFTWGPSFAQWGGAIYQVAVGTRILGTARGLSLTPRVRIRDGAYPFHVLARDRFGQVTASATGRLFVDGFTPTLSVHPSGPSRAGSPVTLLLRVSDRKPSSGLRPVRIAWGDGRVTLARRRASHVYAHSGSYRVRVVASDNAGNARARVVTLTIA